MPINNHHQLSISRGQIQSTEGTKPAAKQQSLSFLTVVKAVGLLALLVLGNANADAIVAASQNEEKPVPLKSACAANFAAPAWPKASNTMAEQAIQTLKDGAAKEEVFAGLNEAYMEKAKDHLFNIVKGADKREHCIPGILEASCIDTKYPIGHKRLALTEFYRATLLEQITTACMDLRP